MIIELTFENFDLRLRWGHNDPAARADLAHYVGKYLHLVTCRVYEILMYTTAFFCLNLFTFYTPAPQPALACAHFFSL